MLSGKTFTGSVWYYDFEIGRLAIADNGQTITHLLFNHSDIPHGLEQRETELIARTAEELREYMACERTVFTIPIAPSGTDFRMAVWRALLTIPYGETRSYKEIAEQVGSPRAYRAVGMANNRNPISIIIPCHRVIGADGSLVGYGGGMEIKKRLLDLESRA